MNIQYWDDLIYEGQFLTEAAEGSPRDVSDDISDSEAGRANTRRDAERYRASGSPAPGGRRSCMRSP